MNFNINLPDISSLPNPEDFRDREGYNAIKMGLIQPRYRNIVLVNILLEQEQLDLSSIEEFANMISHKFQLPDERREFLITNIKISMIQLSLLPQLGLSWVRGIADHYLRDHGGSYAPRIVSLMLSREEQETFDWADYQQLPPIWEVINANVA